MIGTFIRLKAPIAGLGKIQIEFTKRFRKLHPERRMIILQQALKQLRAEYDKAKAENAHIIKAEDATNAQMIRMRA